MTQTVFLPTNQKGKTSKARNAKASKHQQSVKGTQEPVAALQNLLGNRVVQRLLAQRTVESSLKLDNTTSRQNVIQRRVVCDPDNPENCWTEDDTFISAPEPNMSVPPPEYVTCIPPSYEDEAYAIMNSCMDPQQRLQLLVAAQNRRLASQDVPSVGLGSLPADSGDLGQGDFRAWELDLNAAAMNTDTSEGRADVANTVGHEGEHLRQWYEMARLQAGLEFTANAFPRGPLQGIPPSIAQQARLNPINQSDEHTFQVQQWYESVYGSGREHRHQVLDNLPNMLAEYCLLPEERDAWARGQEITNRFRQLDGTPTPSPERDPAICNPEEVFSR